MGRRSEHSIEEIRSMALDAADGLLKEQGLAGFSTRAIAKAMGYTAGTLYLAFRNLDDLVLQLNRRSIQEHGRSPGVGCREPRSRRRRTMSAISAGPT